MKDQRDGIFSLLFNGSRADGLMIEHVITIDCACNMILDFLEKYDIRVTGDSILFCTGDNAYDLKFVEVKRMEEKSVGKSDH